MQALFAPNGRRDSAGVGAAAMAKNGTFARHGKGQWELFLMKWHCRVWLCEPYITECKWLGINGLGKERRHDVTAPRAHLANSHSNQ